MKYVKEYLKDVIKIKPLGELTTKDDELNGMSGEMVYIDGKCSDIFISHADYANWLEKQCEQEEPQVYETEDGEIITYSETDGYKVVEPKFHRGQWITNGDCTWKIVEVKPLDYILQSQDGNIVDDTISYVDNQFHSFDIEDAKDGDVLYSLDSLQPFIYKERKSHEQATAYCGINKYGKFFVWNDKYCIIALDKYVPANKEQRDFLFKKMKEAGYEWNAAKKELKKIESKSAWSEEDESILDSIISDIQLRIEAVENEPTTEMYAHLLYRQITWLKSFKDRIQAQPKQEWSEEDEKMLNSLLHKVEVCDLLTNKENVWIVKKLKSLRPQQQWKPSDEQMKALAQATVPDDCLEAYETLWHDLNNLRKTTK